MIIILTLTYISFSESLTVQGMIVNYLQGTKQCFEQQLRQPTLEEGNQTCTGDRGPGWKLQCFPVSAEELIL